MASWTHFDLHRRFLREQSERERDRSKSLNPRSSSEWRKANVADRWFVYLLYTNRVSNPLYVGFTGNILNRLSQHRRGRAWWPLVDRIFVETIEDRYDALEYEDRCIYHLRPLFNVTNNFHGAREEVGQWDGFASQMTSATTRR